MRVFLEQLFRDGHVTVPASGAPWEFDAEAERWVREFDRSARLALPGAAPELQLAAAKWAAERLADSVRLTIARDAGPEEIARVFARGCPASHSAATDYSVDLFFRYLPEIFTWVRRLAANDPLVAALQTLAAEWPLSSVGIACLASIALEPFIDHAGLRRLYADRIIAREDPARLADPRAAAAVRTALGEHTKLAPACAAAFAPPVSHE